MDNQFNFKLHERLWVFNSDSETIFHAEREGDEFIVSWDESNDSVSIEYKVCEVEQCIKDGDWLLVK